MRILVADDDPVCRHLITSGLAKQGHEVIETASGTEAWKKLHEEEDALRLLVLDWMMPGIDGVELCRRIRREASENYTYVILLTARTYKVEMLAALDAGVDDYLTKPFNQDELHARIKVGIRALGVQQKLVDSHHATQALIDHSPFGIASVAEDATILQSNAAFAKILGFDSPCALAEMPLKRLFSSADEADNMFQMLAQESEINCYEAEWQRADAGRATVRIWARTIPQLGDSGTIEVMIQDVTEQKQLEQRFRQSQKMEAIGRLAGGVSHDFNNLLTVIKGYSGLLMRRNDVTGPVREKLRAIDVAADRAALLTRQLLAFSRQQVLQPRLINLNLVIAEIAEILKRLIGEDVCLSINYDKTLHSVFADPVQMQQVALNLVVNARDAMPNGGELEIRTENLTLHDDEDQHGCRVKAGDYVRIVIRDTGTGMDETTLAHVFEPFFTTKEDRGTGLGLATVYGIVKQSGGFVWASSKLNSGSTFEVQLPAARSRGGALA